MQEWLPLAEAGDAEAQFRVGRLYDIGEGVSVGGAQAVRWYEKAHKQGNLKATYNLARMLDVGERIPRNYGRASTLYLFAACKGHLKSQFNLGLMYMGGHGFPRNYIRAFMWFYYAERNGLSDAKTRYSLFDNFVSSQDKERAKELLRSQKLCDSVGVGGKGL